MSPLLSGFRPTLASYLSATHCASHLVRLHLSLLPEPKRRTHMNLTKSHYTRLGSGSPVLLVNGVFQRRQAWDPIAYSLASQFDVILFDFPNQNMDLNGNGADSSFDRPDLYEDYI